MRTATQSRARDEERREASRRGSGRRIKAAPKAQERSSQLALAMTDALEDILEYERRSA
jgi:hypothetical protein